MSQNPSNDPVTVTATGVAVRLFVAQVIALLAAFGLPITADQTNAILAIAPTVIGLFGIGYAWWKSWNAKQNSPL